MAYKSRFFKSHNRPPHDLDFHCLAGSIQADDHETAIRLTEQAQAGEISEAEWREAMGPLVVAIEQRTGEATIQR